MMTKEQHLASTYSSTNVLVSAGAGSGKTFVLTKRVINILKKGVSINKLLILTFTNAAANEMKERIRQSIISDDSLKKELEYIDNAYITTFDSFALSMLRKYGYLLNIPNTIAIVDESIIKLEKIRIIDEIFEREYKLKNKDFINLIKKTCTKDDKTLRKNILDISEKMDLIIDKKEFLDNYFKKYYSPSFILSIKKEYDDYVMDMHNRILSLYYEILNSKESEADKKYICDLKKHMDGFVKAENAEDIINNIDFKRPSASSKYLNEKIKNLHKEITKILKEYKNNNEYIFPTDFKEYQNELTNDQNEVNFVLKILKELDSKLMEYKLDKLVLEYNDVSRLLINILRTYPFVKEEIKNSFYEILLDEYQDTNDVQDELMKMISNNNIYMVGDVKQSIYRFRNANPNLFIEKYKKYEKNDGGKKIDLNTNFRSRKEVIEYINLMFSNIMSENFGGANYSKDHIIECGNKDYETKGNVLKQNNELEILSYKFKMGGPSRVEIEAFTIVNDIKEKLKNNFKITYKDKITKEMKIKALELKDITILMDNSTHFQTYRKIFEYHGIPLLIVRDVNIKGHDDLLCIKNLLNLVFKFKNETFDNDFKISFMSISRSFLYEIKDNELYNFLKNEDFKNNKIYTDLKPIIDESDALTISQILDKILKQVDFYFKLINIGDVNDATLRIDFIISLIKNLEELNYNLESVVSYFNQIIADDKSKIEVPYVESNQNACKIMTIHASKGLEFPLCYYSGFSSLIFKNDNASKVISFNKDVGIYFIKSDYAKNSLKYILVNNKEKKEEISERIRLLYVALTRSKEKSIIVGDFENENEEVRPINDYEIMSFTEFRHIIIALKIHLDKYIKQIDIKEQNITSKYKLNNASNWQEELRKTDFKIKTIDLNKTPMLLESKKFSANKKEIITKEVYDYIEKGKRIHKILSLIDLKSKNIDDFNIDKLDYQKIKNFLDCNLLKDIQNAKIYKELEFAYNDKENINRGIIDLIIENENEIKIIDYKLANIENEEYEKQLKGYKAYLEKIIKNKEIKLYLYSIANGTYREIR